MPRTGVQYVGNDEPAFIRQFKQRIGHKDGPNIDSKRQIPTNDESDEEVEREDEKPVVVVLQSGDLTAEEAKSAEKEREEGPASLDEKIVFRKPNKRSTTDLNESKGEESEKAACGPKKYKDLNTKTKKTKHSSAKKTKSSNLLSFAVDDDDDDDL